MYQFRNSPVLTVFTFQGKLAHVTHQWQIEVCVHWMWIVNFIRFELRVEMAVGLTSQLFLRLPASYIFCQRNKFRVHIAHWFFGTQSFFCYCFMNLSFSLSLVLCRAIRWGVLFPCHPLRFLQLLMYVFFSIAKLAAQFNHSKTNLEGEDWLVILLLSCSSGRHLTVRVPFSPFSFVFEIWKITPLLCILNILCVI